MKRNVLVLLVMIAILLSACGGGQIPAPELDDIVQSTLQAMTAQAPAATSAPVTGGISGQLSFPSEGLPAQLVVAFSTASNEYFWVQTPGGQSSYQMDGLPAGTYHVVAYALPDGSMAGRYDQFYICGLSQGCADDSWVDVQVQAGVVTPNVDPGNWYGGPENYPPMPAYEPGRASGSGFYSAPMPAGGSIAGQLSYPSSFIPSMVVVAFEVGSQNFRYVITNENSSTYQIDDLAPGSYFVVAYPGGDSTFPGGYSAAVPCGLDASCTDHSLIPVEVKNGEVTQGINPGDFYAPQGSFPPNPVP